MSNKTVKIGPDLPSDLAVTRINSDAPESRPAVVEAPKELTGVGVTDRGDGTYIVKTQDIHGNTVETIMGVAKRAAETVADVKARVTSSYTDTNGNLVETY